MRGTRLAGVVLLCLICASLHAGQITVVLRFDDYSARSNTAFEARLIDTLRKSGVCCTFGVIPFVWGGYGGDPRPQEVIPLSREKAAILKEAMDQGVVDVAMHSYSHQMIGRQSEFAGLSYGEQLARITKGRDLLSALLGVRITTFVPAWNTYDGATLRALHESGFQCLSGDRTGMADSQASCPLRFLPSVCDPAGLREAVRRARRTRDPCPIIVVLFHAYDFIEAKPALGRWSLEDFRELLDWTVSQKDVVVQSIGELLETDMDLSVRRFEDNRRPMVQVPEYAPPILGRLLGVPAPPVYLSKDTIRRESRPGRNAQVLLHVCAVVFYLAAGSAAALAAFLLETRVVARFGHALAVVSRYAAVVLVFAAVGVSLQDDVFGYKCALLVSASLGICGGVHWRAFRNRRTQRAGALPTAPRSAIVARSGRS